MATTIKFDFHELFGILYETAIEKFPEHRARTFVANHWTFAIQLSFIYFFAVFGIRYFMKNRKALDLQRPLNAWNLFLAVFSTLGTLFMAPDFFGTLFNKGYRASYCDSNKMTEGINGLWMFLFVTSKSFELIDTIFIVLRKKPLVFLHWYHHILTLLHCFYTYPVTPAYNRWGAYLNFAVHSSMYCYYFVRSIGIKVPGKIAKAITTGQIIQFVLSIIVLASVGVDQYVLGYGDCTFDGGAFWFAFAMDLTYLGLFINFFKQAYIVKDKYNMKKDTKSE